MYKDMLVLYFRICDQFNSQNYTQVMTKSFTLSLEDLLNESINHLINNTDGNSK